MNNLNKESDLMFDRVNEYKCSINIDGFFINANDAILSELNLSISQIKKMQFSDLIHVDFKDQVTQFYLDKFQQNKEIVYHEFRTLDIAGKEKWIGLYVSEKKSENEIIGYQIIGSGLSDLRQNQLQLSYFSNRMISLINHLDAGIVLEDENRKIVYANQNYCDIFQILVPASQLTGEDCNQSAKMAMHLFEDGEQFIERINILSKAKKIALSEEVPFASGMYFERDYIPVFEDGIFKGQIWRYRDITHRKRTSMLAEGYANSINESAIVEILDSNGSCVYANDKYCAISQYETKELIGKNSSQFRVSEYDHVGFDVIQRSVEKNGIWKEESKNIAKDGSIYWLNTIISPFINIIGAPKQYLSISFDISEKKVYEEELKKIHIELKESLKVKEQFLDNISHEMYTPMNSILGFTNLLLESHLDEVTKVHLQAVKKSGNQLLSIINDMIEFSHSKSPKNISNYSRINIPKDLESLINQVKIKTVKKGLGFFFYADPAIPKELKGDLTKIKKILDVFISNALKFTTLGLVSIRISLVKESDDSVQLSFAVQDTGIGIAEDKTNEIFDCFNLADNNSTREFGGAGLGLSIANELSKKINGQVIVKSELRKGSIFELLAPFKKIVDKPSKEEVKSNDSDNGNKELNISVLVVDDNNMNILTVQSWLKRWKCVVGVANNGLEAIESIKKNDYDIILMDIQMPKMNGIEASKIIRNELPDDKSSLPIIGMSANNPRKEFLKDEPNIMNDFLVKPFDPDNLFDKLRHWSKSPIESIDLE